MERRIKIKSVVLVISLFINIGMIIVVGFNWDKVKKFKTLGTEIELRDEEKEPEPVIELQGSESGMIFGDSVLINVSSVGYVSQGVYCDIQYRHDKKDIDIKESRIIGERMHAGQSLYIKVLDEYYTVYLLKIIYSDKREELSAQFHYSKLKTKPE